MIGIALFITAALIVITLIMVVNVVTFPRLRHLTPQPPLHNMERGCAMRGDTSASSVGAQHSAPLLSSLTTDQKSTHVSMLIPARNEAAVIGDTVRALLAQQDVDLEVIVLDDQSDDGTANLARAAAANDARLQVINGEPLPKGWLGKNWACHQLAQAATGQVLIFTDADVCWHPGALAALLDEMRRSGADLLSIWPTQQTETWGERLVVPLMALVIFGYLPSPLVHHTRWAAFAAANGQCLAFRRAAYEAISGHESVADQIVEDITLARRIKRRGLRLRMVDGNKLIVCRMYRDWRSVREGYAKNVIAGYGGHVSLLLLATVFHWLVFLAPWLWLLAGRALVEVPNELLWPLALVSLGVGVRALSAVATHQRIIDALWMPVSVLLMTAIAAHAIWMQWRYGGPQWKGRLLNPEG